MSHQTIAETAREILIFVSAIGSKTVISESVKSLKDRILSDLKSYKHVETRIRKLESDEEADLKEEDIENLVKCLEISFANNQDFNADMKRLWSQIQDIEDVSTMIKNQEHRIYQSGSVHNETRNYR